VEESWGDRWKEVGVEVENKKNFPLLFSSVILILEVLNMAKKLKYQLTKNTFVDNDIVRYSDAFKNLNASQINLFLFLCCLAKQQYDVEKDDETEGKKTGWSDEIKINMIDFCKVCGKKTDWFDMPKEKKDAILDCFRDLQKQQFTLYKSKRRSLSDGFESYNYLSYVIYKNNVLTISMDEKTRLFFMNYDCFFTSYEIGQVIQLKSETSKLLYIYLRSFWDANKKQFLPTSLSLDNFRDIVGKTGSYLEYKDLKRHVLEKAIAEINEKTDIIISGDYDVYRHLTNGNEENMTPEEINKCRIKSMEMRTDDENRKTVTGLTFRMTMKPKEVAEDYLYDLFDDELIAERMRLKAMKKRVNENLEENKKFRRNNNTPNKKI